MDRLIKTYMTWPLCLFFVAGLVLGGYGSVLCVGDDGLLKVESVCQPCFNDAGEVCSSEPAGSGHEHQNDCLNCSDLPLHQNFLSPRPHVRKIGASPVHNNLLVRLTTPVHSQISQPVLESPGADPELPSAIKFLSTIVLRC